eukprot:CAMPEP_0173432904 /NCGR_PEP_ID=MMETSP1357-20121228/10550_1 /TAXON_ID=77926 /ORGANISM="Hemiselmis rufescens, Strain PCC563" /LENGTH=166 /DNA_ID=CAMNT_0014397569 /DNA_START=16 /DNA_END=513 /DNA_ORIENTATION=+
MTRGKSVALRRGMARRRGPSGALAALIGLCAVCAVGAGGSGGKAPAKGGGGRGGGGGGGDEEIIIPLGGEVSIPLAMPQFNQMPGIQMPKGLGNGQSVGFEETEEIGPDGKPHIISEKSFTPGGGKASGKPLTKAQKAQQKAMQKEMKGMAKDMSHMFQGGMFGGG